MTKIAIFGLSANPPTGTFGHQGIVRNLVSRGDFNEIWIMPVYKHIFTSKNTLANFEHRLEMCRICFVKESSSFTNVKVVEYEKNACLHYLNSIENSSSFRVGTIDVLNYIRSQNDSDYHDAEFTLILGTDTFRDFAQGKWKASDKIIEMCNILVISREGTPSWQSSSRNEEDDRIAEFVQQYENRKVNFFHSQTLGKISSTELRALKPWEICEYTNESHIDSEVLQYIRSHHVFDCLDTIIHP